MHEHQLLNLPFQSQLAINSLRNLEKLYLLAYQQLALLEYCTHGGGYSISAELPIDGQLGKNSYTDTVYNITSDLVSALPITTASQKPGTFASNNNSQEITSSKPSLTITALGGGGIFLANNHNQTINLSDVSLLSSNVGTVFAISTTPLDYRDENLASKLITQRVTGNFKTIAADITMNNYQFGLANDPQAGALIYNKNGLQILGESEDNPGGFIEKMALTLSSSVTKNNARGVAILNYGSGPNYFSDQQIYMPINQIGDEDNRFGAGVESVYGNNQYIQKIGSIYATTYGIANGSGNCTGDGGIPGNIGKQTIIEIGTIDVDNTSGYPLIPAIGIYNWGDDGASLNGIRHIGIQYVGITGGIRAKTTINNSSAYGIYNRGGVSTIESKNSEKPIWVETSGNQARSIYISPRSEGPDKFNTSTQMKGSFDIRSGDLVVANNYEKSLTAHLDFNTTQLPNSDTLTLGPDVNIQVLQGKFAADSPTTSLSFGDKLDPLTSGYKVRLGKSSFINDKGAFNGNSTLYFGTSWQKQTIVDEKTGSTTETDVLKVNTNGIIFNNVGRQSNGDPTRLNLAVTIDTDNLPASMSGGGYSGTDNVALMKYLNTDLNALQLLREAANNVVIGDEVSRQNIAPADGYFESRYGNAETGLKIKEENFYPVLRLDSNGKAVGIYVGKQVEDKFEHYSPEGADWKCVGIEKGEPQTIKTGEWQKLNDGTGLTLAAYKEYLSKGYTVEAYLNGKPLSQEEIENHLLKETDNLWKDESREGGVYILYPDAKHRYEKEHKLITTGWIAANENNLHNPFNLYQEYEILPSLRKVAGYVELSIPEGLVTPEATYVAPYYFEDVRAVGNPNNITDALVDGSPRVETLYAPSDAEGTNAVSGKSPTSLQYMGQVFGLVEVPVTDETVEPYVRYEPLKLYEEGETGTENRLTVSFTDCDGKCDNPGNNDPVIDKEVHNPTTDPSTGYIIPGNGSTSTMDALSSISMTNYFLWRQENETLYQRMGEIRDRADLEGGWVRVLGGKNTYDRGNAYFKNRYHGVQLGFDHVADKENNGQWIFGAALGYTRGSSDYSYGGSGKNWIGSISAYAVKKFDNGAYLDLILKGSRLNNDFTAISKLNRYISKGKFHTFALQASVEAGHKFLINDNWYVDPQLQLTYGHIKEAKYRTDTRINVHLKGSPSTIGRAGISLGREAKEGSAFVKIDALREFTAKYKATYSLDNGAKNKNSISMKDTWGEISVGGTYNFNKDTYGFAQIKRSFGAQIQQEYRADIGIRYVF